MFREPNETLIVFTLLPLTTTATIARAQGGPRRCRRKSSASVREFDPNRAGNASVETEREGASPGHLSRHTFFYVRPGIKRQQFSRF